MLTVVVTDLTGEGNSHLPAGLRRCKEGSNEFPKPDASRIRGVNRYSPRTGTSRRPSPVEANTTRHLRMELLLARRRTSRARARHGCKRETNVCRVLDARPSEAPVSYCDGPRRRRTGPRLDGHARRTPRLGDVSHPG